MWHISSRYLESLRKNILRCQGMPPKCASYVSKPLDALYRENENEKKRKYNERVLNIEKASFTPLVFLSTGGQSKECDRLNKRLSEMIANKRKEQYCHVVAHVRTRLRFSLLKSTLTALRGYRGKQSHSRVAALSEIWKTNIIQSNSKTGLQWGIIFYSYILISFHLDSFCFIYILFN